MGSGQSEGERVMTKRYFEYKDAKSTKFWEVSVSGKAEDYIFYMDALTGSVLRVLNQVNMAR